ncbi:MAG: NADAR family protein [Chitinophagaceae bacterium]|nr:NADAR family protein [Chitinophagaceae bacterium]
MRSTQVISIENNVSLALSKKKILNALGEYKFNKQIEKQIKINLQFLSRNPFIKNRIGIFSNEDFFKKFSIAGSYKIRYIEQLGQAKKYFEQKKYRFFSKGGWRHQEIHTRGPRYIIANDLGFSVVQKMKILQEDILDGLEYLKSYIFSKTNQINELAPVLDYIKNAIITLFNAYTNREKLGQLETTNQVYQQNKKALKHSACEATFCYYQSLLNLVTENDIDNLLKNVKSGLLLSIIESIKTEFKEFKFSSKAVVRPEASHPIILMSHVHLIVERHPDINVVFGLPSGGTELACLIHKYYLTRGVSNDLFFLPISLHSIKNQTATTINYNKIVEILPDLNSFHSLKGLLIDDNSATGSTMNIAKEILLKKYLHISLICTVAEADLTRIKINIEDKEKGHSFANPILFNNSVGVLPISKIINSKHDLKEVSECRSLYSFYLKQIKRTDTLVNQIKMEIIADSIEAKTEFILPKLNAHNAILTFKHTFLSNFYAVPITYKDRYYPSVEHAYLAQKFNEKDLASLNSKQKRELNDILKMKGIIIQLHDFRNAFKDINYASGVLKRFSNKLKSWGLEVSNWDDHRLDIMIELLLKKFSKPEFMSLLLETGNKVLIEGNTWNDTYWGVCDGSGKNYLGRIIMNIRRKIIRGEIRTDDTQHGPG